MGKETKSWTRFRKRKDVLEQYKCYEEGYVTLEDIVKILEDEAGIKIKGY